MNARRLTLTTLVCLSALPGWLVLSSSDAFAAPPALSGVFVKDVTATSAELRAQVDPMGTDTTYYAQYGPVDCSESPSSCTSQPLPPGTDAGEGLEEQTVTVVVENLQPSTTYHYRFLALNALGHAESADRMFTTQPPGQEFALPDGRVWEMVSPPNKYGASIEPIGLGAIQSSDTGGAMSYFATAPVVANPSSNDIEETQVLSTRGSGGWTSQDISTPHTGVTGVQSGTPPEYRLFSRDLTLAAVEPLGEEKLSPSASEKTIYLRDGSGGYLPLVTAANATAKTAFGGKLGFIGASSDLSHAIVSSSVPLTSTPAPEGGLYEWNKGIEGGEGQLELVSILPNGEAASGEPVDLGYSDFGQFGALRDVRGAISEDGMRVFWTRRFSTGPHIYVRDTEKGQTLQVDAAQGLPEPGAAEAVYQAATPDGSRVFFTDGARLTPDATAAGPSAPDLYECELTESGGRLACNLTDLTAGDLNAGEHAEVQGAVFGISADGSRVYFVANGVLATGAAPGHCGEEGGDCNLYVSHDGHVTFIATLSEEDKNDWTGAHEQRLGYMTSRVSPDGRYLAFMSDRSLTGYDNVDANGEQPDEEVFLYDSDTARLICASCDPSGARPQGALDPSFFSTSPWLLVDRGGALWSGQWLAASLPGWMVVGRNISLHQPRYLDDGGRLFFNSADALVPQDVNGKEDVYEYEPGGTGSCTSSDSTFDERIGGCVALISSGGSSEESALLDASDSGGDVFFLTTSRLAAQDTDTSFDVYDAHECSAESPCVSPLPVSPLACVTADSCRTAPSPQPTVYGPPATQTFTGAGNLLVSRGAVTPKRLTHRQALVRKLRKCRKKPKRKRVFCEARARRRHGSNKTKRGGR